MNLKKVIVLVTMSTLLFSTGLKAGTEKDCFEKVSREIFKFNQGFDKAILKPIAAGYNKLPDPIKKGTGNSVHQEKLDTFIPFIKNQLNATLQEINAIKLFVWSDGTIDGTGEIRNRKNIKEMAIAYPFELKIAQNFLNTYKKTLIHRFVTTGIYKDSPKVTHLIYGEVNNICVAPIQKVELFLSNTIAKASLSVGKLSFQAWNIVKNGNPNTEDRRGQIQLKWSGLKKDIIKI